LADKSAIQWTEATWNPVTGCTKVSPGCANCYIERTPAFRMAHRRFERGSIPVLLHADRLDQPLRWKRPRLVFVNSLSDLFHEDVPDGFIAWVWLTMARTPHHTYQILTKRPERMLDWLKRWNDVSGEDFNAFKNARGPEATRASHPSPRGQIYASFLEELGKPHGGVPPEGAAWPTFDWMEGEMRWPLYPLRNVWLGVSVENQRFAEERIPLLLGTPAAVRFLSCEPLLGALDLRCGCGALGTNCPKGESLIEGIDWVIVGGESGPGRTERKLVERTPQGWQPTVRGHSWVSSLRDQCVAAGVPFFFKQWGGPTPKAGGRRLDGREWDEMPGGAEQGTRNRGREVAR